jgi:hypothetical protein
MDRSKGAFIIAAVAVASFIGAAGTDAQAQNNPAAAPAARVARERGHGLMFGVHALAAPGVSISGEDIGGSISTAFGPGAGLMIGYGFTRAISVYVSLDAAKQNSGTEAIEGSWGLAHAEIGARANLSSNPLLTPYITAALGNRAVGARITDHEFDEEYDLTFSGPMFSIGGGFERALSATMSLDIGGSIGLGRFSTADEDGDKQKIDVNNSTSTRLRAGLIWRP